MRQGSRNRTRRIPGFKPIASARPTHWLSMPVLPSVMIQQTGSVCFCGSAADKGSNGLMPGEEHRHQRQDDSDEQTGFQDKAGKPFPGGAVGFQHRLDLLFGWLRVVASHGFLS